MNQPRLPDGLEHVRTTDTFDNDTVPAGLLRAHRVADGVWGRLVVHSGTVSFVFDDEPEHPITVSAGDAVAIPPARQHHLELHDAASFAVVPPTPEHAPQEAGREHSASGAWMTPEPDPPRWHRDEQDRGRCQRRVSTTRARQRRRTWWRHSGSCPVQQSYNTTSTNGLLLAPTTALGRSRVAVQQGEHR